MEIIIFSIPFIVALFFLFFFRKKIVPFEYAIIILPPILLCLIVMAIMKCCNEDDTEYLGSYITRITHYDPWDELVDVRHEEEVYKGKDSDGNDIYETRVWYTKEREYHSDSWTCCTSDSRRESYISEKKYNIYKTRLNNKSVFRDMHRDYYRIDGDAHDIFWDKTPAHIYDITKTHSYKNKVAAYQSNSIFKKGDITKEEAAKIGLKEYPTISIEGFQNPIIGFNASDGDIQQIRYVNAMHGSSHQFRMYILCFQNKDIEISELQKAYWQGGNKNEFIVCLGIQKDSVVWCNPFSWCDEPRLEVITREYFIENPHLDIKKYGEWIDGKIKGNWHRKEFKDFDYIRVPLSKGENIALLIIMVIATVICTVLVITNEIDNDE